jgi:hypothetical protein
MRKIPLFSMPGPSTGTVDQPIYETAGPDLVLRLALENYDEQIEDIQIIFRRHRASCYRAESHCTLWHVDGTYDTVCEVESSEWVDRLANDTPKLSHNWVLRHFMIYLDSFGCLQVVAESAEIVARKRM